MRLSRIRATAIESSTAAVLLEGEKLVMGHTFLSPLEPGAIKVGVKGFEEKVVIISDRAVYVVAFEYTLMIVSLPLSIPFTSRLILGCRFGILFEFRPPK